MFYAVQLNRTLSELEDLTFQEIKKMLDYEVEKRHSEYEYQQNFELFITRRLAYSIIRFFPERYKGRLKETSLWSIPAFDQHSEEKASSVVTEEERERVRNRFKKISDMEDAKRV